METITINYNDENKKYERMVNDLKNLRHELNCILNEWSAKFIELETSNNAQEIFKDICGQYIEGRISYLVNYTEELINTASSRIHTESDMSNISSIINQDITKQLKKEIENLKF